MQSPDLAWLVVAAVLNSLVSVYYYLRIVVAMYFRDPCGPGSLSRRRHGAGVGRDRGCGAGAGAGARAGD